MEASVVVVGKIPVVVVVDAAVSCWGNAFQSLDHRGEEILPQGTDIHPGDSYLGLVVDFVHYHDDTD